MSNEKGLVSFDYAIKYLLKDKGDYEIVEGFISALFASEGYKPIKIKALLESESNKESKHLKRSIADVIVEDEEGNEVPEDKYYIYPSGRATYGYGKQYEWLGGGNGFNPKTYDVYTEDEADDAAKVAIENMLDDMGHEAFSEWVYEDALDTQSWISWLQDFYDDYVRNDPENYDIPLELSNQQMKQVQQLQANLDSLNKRLETEELPDDQYEQIESQIEDLEEYIQNIKDDPQGGYDESAIENEINDRVNEWEDDIKGFIGNYGYDKNFIMDFIDTDSITNTVVNSDGYGSILNSYDGDYDTYNINGTEYYVMRVS